MIEKVSPEHPDKIADRIAGAIVDLAYTRQERPKVAVEVLIGHGKCLIINETSCHLEKEEVEKIVNRIAGPSSSKPIIVDYTEIEQDAKLANNQKDTIKCGDNGIFKGVPTSEEELLFTNIAQAIYETYPYDGKYIIDTEKEKIIICQSHAANKDLADMFANNEIDTIIINPLGEWTGGLDVDSGATNRKLGSDMGRSVTGGGLHGKDLSKADVSVNIYAYLEAQRTKKPVELCCAIGDEQIDGKPYSEIVEIAREYINSVGGFEKFAEWGLIK